MSLATSVPASTATKQRGTLFKLPREVRDMIYRYVVNGTYLIDARPDPTFGILKDIAVNPTMSVLLGENTLSSDLDILCVSKSISDEAMAVLYSESIFRIYVTFDKDQVLRLSSTPALKRMMTIELAVGVHHGLVTASHAFPIGSGLECLNSEEQIWKATLACISRTNKLRNNLHIRYRRFFTYFVLNGRSVLSDTIPDWMFSGLKSMTHFHTVIIQNIIYSLDCNEREYLVNKQNHETNAIEKYLRRALGPAVHAQQGCAVNLTFHPQRHLPAIPNARAANLRVEVDELETEAKRAEECT